MKMKSLVHVLFLILLILSSTSAFLDIFGDLFFWLGAAKKTYRTMKGVRAVAAAKTASQANKAMLNLHKPNIKAATKLAYNMTKSALSSSSSSSSSRFPNYCSSETQYNIPYWKRNSSALSPTYWSDILHTQRKTVFGTEFSTQEVIWMKGRLGKKSFGLGVKGPVFLGGEEFGVGVGLLSYSIIHRYFYVKNIMYEKGFGSDGWDYNFYETNYKSNVCNTSCPKNTHCEWGYCECNAGFNKFRGKCFKSVPEAWMEYMKFDVTGNSCRQTKDCQKYDINFICDGNNKCRCKENMKYNPNAQECQILMNINCGNWTYESAYSQIVKATADTVLKDIEKSALSNSTAWGKRIKPIQHRDQNRTETIEESLNKSILKPLKLMYYDKVTLEDLQEAFCREVDAFNSAYITDDCSRPKECSEISQEHCAVLHDSSSCKGGWSLNVTEDTSNNMAYKYRNDVDTIGVRHGCTFTGFTSRGFSGNKMLITADSTDRWIVLENSKAYKKFHEDIESYNCKCRK